MKKLFIGLVASAVMGMGLSVWADSLIDGNWAGIITGSSACNGVDLDFATGNTIKIQNLIATSQKDPTSGATLYAVTNGVVSANNNTKGSKLNGVIYYGGWNLNSIFLSTDSDLAIQGNYIDPSSSDPKGVFHSTVKPNVVSYPDCKVWIDLHATSSVTKK
jgi:hypothetical protein